MKDFFYKYSDNINLTAIRTPSQSLTYKELFNSANELELKISWLNNFTSQYIPILSSNNVEFIELVLALWNLGFVPVPINIRWTEKEIESVIIRHNFNTIFLEEKFSQKIKNLNIKKIFFNELLSLPSGKVKKKNNDEALVIFTSGSTGEPKGVVHTFSSLANSIINGSAILSQNESDKWLASLPFFHIGGFQIICRVLSNGCEVIIPKNSETESLKESIEQFNPTHISLVSTQLKRLIENGTRTNKSLKLTLIGGGFTDDELILEADEFGWKPVRVYGSSETASFISAAYPEEIRLKPNTVGKPIKNVQLKISDEGEILISTNSLFSKYLNNIDETNARLKNRFYHSGDLGRIEDEYLFIESRKNDLIVTGGENVNPYEVEKALLEIDGVADACVFPIEDKQWGQIVAAAIVFSKKLSEDEIKNELKKSLSAYKIPKKIFFVDELPKTSLGKTERIKIRQMFGNQ